MIPLLWLYILLVFLLLILIVLLLPVRIYVSYYKDIKVNLYIGFVKLQLLPEKEKKKVKKSTDKKTDKPKKKKDEPAKSNFFKEKGLAGLLEIIKKVSELAANALKDFFKHIIVKNLMLSVSVAGEDAADTAIKYGEYCAAVYPAISLIAGAVKCKNYGVDITPNFNENAETEFSFELDAKVLILWIVALVLKHGFKGIKLLIELKGE